MQKIIVVGGPTAIGKTKLAIQTAEEVDGELINADSVQIYKYMDIGSNKGNLKKESFEKLGEFNSPIVKVENTKVKGHLFNIVKPDYNFTLYNYKNLAEEVINNLTKDKKVPILVGGTGLYIDSVLKDYTLKQEENRYLRTQLERLNLKELQDKLQAKGIKTWQSLNNSDKNNPRRLIRLIEKGYEQANKQQKSKYDVLFLYPHFERTKLYKKIDQRVIEMFNEGLVNEVKQLLSQGYNLLHKSMQSTGYRQIAEMLLNNKYKSSGECIEAVQKAHRNYAKRQITWFEGKGRGYNLVNVKQNTLQKKLEKFI